MLFLHVVTILLFFMPLILRTYSGTLFTKLLTDGNVDSSGEETGNEEAEDKTGSDESKLLDKTMATANANEEMQQQQLGSANIITGNEPTKNGVMIDGTQIKEEKHEVDETSNEPGKNVKTVVEKGIAEGQWKRSKRPLKKPKVSEEYLEEGSNGEKIGQMHMNQIVENQKENDHLPKHAVIQNVDPKNQRQHYHENDEENIDRDQHHQPETNVKESDGKNSDQQQEWEQWSQQYHEKEMPAPFLDVNDPFFPTGVFDDIVPDEFGSYLNSLPDHIGEKHVWELARDGNKYHQLPNGEIYMQDANGKDWMIIAEQQVPRHEKRFDSFYDENFFDGVLPNKDGSYQKWMEDGRVYEFKNGIAYYQEPDGGLFFKDLLNNGSTFYQTPDQMHLFKYLPNGNAEYVPVNMPENGSSHGVNGHVKNKKRRGVRITELNEDGTPKEAATDEDHFGHTGRNETSSPESSDERKIEITYHVKNGENIKKLKLNEKITKRENSYDPQSGKMRHGRIKTVTKLHQKYRENGVLEKSKLVKKEQKVLTTAHPKFLRIDCREKSTCVTTTKQTFNEKGELTGTKKHVKQITKNMEHVVHSAEKEKNALTTTKLQYSNT